MLKETFSVIFKHRVRGSFFDVASSVGWAAEPLIFAWESGNMVEILSLRANQFSSFSGFFRTAYVFCSPTICGSTALFSVIKSKASITDWNATLSLPSASCFLMTFFDLRFISARGVVKWFFVVWFSWRKTWLTCGLIGKLCRSFLLIFIGGASFL